MVAVEPRSRWVVSSKTGKNKIVVDNEYFKQMKRLQKMRARQKFVLNLFNSWLSKEEQPYTIEEMTTIVSSLEVYAHLIADDQERNLLLIPVVVYADKYAKAAQKLFSRDQIRNLLLISLVLTLKFWEDRSVDLESAGAVFGIPKKSVAFLEKKFLSALGWNLYISKDDVENYNLKKLWANLF